MNNRWRDLLLRGETTATQFMLALIAFTWAAGLALPGDTFERPVYRYMHVFGDERRWMWMWTLHGLLLMWGIRRHLPTPLRIANNCFGLALFSGAATAIFATRTFPFPAGIAPDIVAALASFWLFLRTLR